MALYGRKVSVMLSIAALACGCNETLEADPSALGVDYYPVEIGQYRIYEVEEVTFLITGSDTSTYQLRETIIDSLVSLDQTTYLIQRDTRADAMGEWESDSLWTVTPTSLNVSVAENNIPFIKLTFPVREGIEWDGNSLNTRGNQTYYYENLMSSDFTDVPVEDQIRVIIEDIPENTTGIDLRSEGYARTIGLVEKDYITQVRCTASSCGDDFGKVESGRSLKQRLIEYGVSNN